MSGYSVYCDESCHLQNDKQRAMVIGSVWCPTAKVQEISARIKEIKVKHGLSPYFEIKWTKVSPSKAQFFTDLVDYFFDDDDLYFRSVVVPEKASLNHEKFNQTHDDWYYKMFFVLLERIINPKDNYQIYLDIKDSRSARKLDKLREVLANANYDFNRSIVDRMQFVRSHEVQLQQLSDLLIGAISYASRGIESSATKLALIERIRKRSGYNLKKSTLPTEKKFNVFLWRANT
ncbi:MAG: DUF3800 domain-containing protein [Ferrovibrio sp.]